MSNNVEILIIAKDEASDVADKVAKAIGGIGAGAGGINIASAAMSGLKVAAGGALAILDGVGAILTASVKEAAESQAALAQLDSVLKSTGADQRAIGVATQEATYHTVVSAGHTAASGKELGKLSGQLEKAKAHLAQLNASWADHKTHTNSATLAMQNAQAKVAALTQQIAAGGQIVGKGMFKVADVLPPLQMSREALINQATALSRVTKYQDETIIGAESMLLTFTNIGGKAMPAATEAVLDLSTAMGTDTKSSAVMLGKALNDPIKGVQALTRVGVTFTDEQKNLIKHLQKSGDMLGAQKVILAEVNKEFGGSAKAAGQTFAGQLEIAKNAIGELEEAIGTRLLPILTPLIGKFTDFAMQAMPLVEDAVGAVGDVIEGVIEFITGASNGLGSLQDAGASLAKVFGGSASEWQKAVEWMAQAAKDMVTAVKNAWEGLKTIGTWTTTVLVPWLKKAWDTIKADAKAFGDWLKPYEDWLWNAAIDSIVWFNNKAVPWLKKAWEDIKATAKVFGDWLAPYMKTVWDAAIDAIVWFNNKAVPWLKKAWEDIKATAKMIFWDWIVPYIATQLGGALLVFTWFKENVVPLLVKAWDTLKADAKRLWFNWIVPYAQGVWIGLGQVFNWLKDTGVPLLLKGWQQLKLNASMFLDWLAPKAAATWAEAAKGVQFFFDKVVPYWTDKWDTVKKTVNNVLVFIGTIINDAWADAFRVTGFFLDKLAPYVDKIWQGIKTSVFKVMEWLRPYVEPIWDALKSALGIKNDAIQTKTETVWSGIKTSLGITNDGIQTKTESVWNDIKRFSELTNDQIKEKADAAWKSLKESVIDWITQTYDGVVGKLDELKKAWDKHHEAVEAAVQKAWDWIYDNINGTLNDLHSFIVEILGKIKEALQGAWNSIKSAAKTEWDKLKDIIGKALDDARGIINGFLSWVGSLVIKIPEIKFPSTSGFSRSSADGISSAAGFGGGGRGSTTNNTYLNAPGATLSRSDFKQMINEALAEAGRRGDARMRMG